jgi:hypothetical protein
MNRGMINTLSDSELKKFDDQKNYLSGDGFFKYYEYLEVKQAFTNAEIATKQAKDALFYVKISLIISASVGLTQILLMVFQ